VNETMVTVTGNVAGDVISRRVGTNEEHLLVTFRVASSERRFDKASESWIDGDRFTASVNCWRRLAEGARTSLVKGDPVVVTGRLSVREYESEGGRRYMTEIAATAVGPDLSRCSAEVRRRRQPAVEGGEAGTGDGAGTAEVPGTPAVDGVLPGRDEGDEAVAVAVGSTPGHAGPDREEGAVTVAGDGALPESAGATITGIGVGDRRRSGASRASA
jgi:single-strand DNA-binding protein